MDSKLELLQDVLLHLEKFILRVGMVSDVDVVSHPWRVDLLILASNHHGSHSDELEIFPVNSDVTQVPVNEVDGEEECLRQQSILDVDLDKPINQNLPHRLVDIILVLHVVGLWHALSLDCQAMIVDEVSMLSYVMGIEEGGSILLANSLLK